MTSNRSQSVLVRDSASEAADAPDKPSVLLSRTTMNQNTRNALRSLVEHDMLAEFWTTFAWDRHSAWNRFLPRSWQTRLMRRSISEAPADKIRTAPIRELIRQGARGTPFERLLCSGERPFSVYGMGRHFDEQVAQRIGQLRPDAVYANEGAALHTFRKAKKLGIIAIDEQSSSYWKWVQALRKEEAELNPEFANLLPGVGDSPEFLHQKEEELHLADYIFVPSTHVLRTFQGEIPPEKIRVIPYGAPEVMPRDQFNLDIRRPLQVLFVGYLAQTKGISYLLDAMDILGPQAELTMIGRRIRPNRKVDDACTRWHWFESLPHSQVLDVMQRVDVLVLPSLSDAFGLVVTEALACGLPVIVTHNSGVSELLRDERDGFVVPIRRADMIAERLEALARDREMLVEMSRQAQQTAAENSWSMYRTRWARAIWSLAWQ